MTVSNWNEIWQKLQSPASEDDFELWQDLIDAVQGLHGGMSRYSSPEAFDQFRLSYESLLRKFPYCHGYWIRYANDEFRYGSSDNAIKVYQRAVTVMPFCVDLWSSYLQLYMSVNVKNPEQVRQLFDYAALFIGSHFLSHSFWNLYLLFEKREADVFPAVAKEQRYFKLLERIVQLPLHQYSSYFSKLQEALSNVPLEAPFFSKSSGELIANAKSKKHANNNKSKTNSGDVKSSETELRSKLWSHYTSLYYKVQDQVNKRIPFEVQITRPFFHVAELPESEYANWRNYLDFEESEANHARIKLLYERAIIATAHSEEFWLRYYRWLAGNGYIQEAKVVLQRAMSVLPLNAVGTRIIYSKLEESLANTKASREIYLAALSELPNNLTIIKAFTGFLGRNGEDALSYLSSHLSEHQSSFSAQDEALVKLEALRHEVDKEKVRATYQKLSASLPTMFQLWKDFLDFEIQQPDTDGSKHNQVQLVFSFIRSSPLEASQKKELAQVYMAYLLDQTKTPELIKEYFRVDKAFNHQATLG